MKGFKSRSPTLAVMMSMCFGCFNGGLKPPNTDNPRMNGVKIIEMGARETHNPKPRSMRGRGNGPETRPGAKPGGSRACSPKPPRSKGNPRPSGRGGGQYSARYLPKEFAREDAEELVRFAEEVIRFVESRRPGKTSSR